MVLTNSNQLQPAYRLELIRRAFSRHIPYRCYLHYNSRSASRARVHRLRSANCKIRENARPQWLRMYTVETPRDTGEAGHPCTPFTGSPPRKHHWGLRILTRSSISFANQTSDTNTYLQKRVGSCFIGYQSMMTLFWLLEHVFISPRTLCITLYLFIQEGINLILA